MILVTGATGHLGGASIDFLLKKNSGAKIKALVRSEEKGKALKDKGVDTAVGDYLDYDSLLKAMEGVESVLFVSSGSMENRLQQHKNLVNAAKQQGVKHIVYTGMLKASMETKFTAGKIHKQTEDLLLESGLNYTIMRNTYYADQLPGFLGNAVETGTIYYPAGNARANFALRSEMAEANAVVLANIEQHKDKIYEITSGAAYSFEKIAEMLSGITDKEIKYVDIPLETYKNNLVKAGLPEEIAEMITTVAESIRAGEFDYVDPALENLLGRKPVDLKESLKMLYA